MSTVTPIRSDTPLIDRRGLEVEMAAMKVGNAKAVVRALIEGTRDRTAMTEEEIGEALWVVYGLLGDAIERLNEDEDEEDAKP